MAEIVTGFSCSHAPMMSADPASAPPEMAERFFTAVDRLTDSVRQREAQALVMVSGEHFSNFFLDNLPQVSIGLGETHLGPVEKWLGIDRVVIPGQPALADQLLTGLIERDHLPGLSHRLIVDHGFMTVYDRLSPDKDLPLVPVVVNCTSPPLITLRQAWNFGLALGAAIRDFDGLERVALCGAGGLSHFVGEPRVGDLDEDFDRWFLGMLEQGCPDDLLDLGNDELATAGNGTGEVRAWVMVAAAMAGSRTEALSYEPIYEWINGMGAVLHTPLGEGA